MKKLALLSVVAAFVIVGFCQTAFALTVLTDWSLYESDTAPMPEVEYVGEDGHVNSGILLGIFGGNDSNQLNELESWLKGLYGEDFQLVEYAKYDLDEDEYSGNSSFEVTLDTNPTEEGGDPISGTWSTSGDLLSLYTVKGANAFALYEVDPLNSEGAWSTYDLWVHGFGGEVLEVSHLSGFNSVPIPEPATMILFGTGLLALAGAGRKKFMKR